MKIGGGARGDLLRQALVTTVVTEAQVAGAINRDGEVVLQTEFIRKGIPAQKREAEKREDAASSVPAGWQKKENSTGLAAGGVVLVEKFSCVRYALA